MSWLLPRAGALGASPCSPAGSVSAEPRSRGPNARVSLVAALASLLGGISPLAVPPALLLGSLSLLAFAAAPAEADVLVSNIGQTQGNAIAFSGTFTSLGFTTGSNSGGYTLESIEVKLDVTGGQSLTDSERGTLRAELWSSIGSNPASPNVKLASLTVPSSVTNGTTNVTFTAPSNTSLNASTTYHVVVYTTGSLPKLRWRITSSNNEDSGGAAGWSILNISRYQNSNSPIGSSWSTNGNVPMIRVNGAAKQAAVSTPAAPTNLSVSRGNGVLQLSWTAPSGTLTGYDIHYTSAASGTVANDATATGSDASAAWVADASGASASDTSEYVSDLTNGVTYRLRLRAKNASGNGAWAFTTGTPNVALKWPGSTYTLAEGSTGNQLTLTEGGLIKLKIAASGTLTYAAGTSNPASLSADLTTGYATTFSAAAGANLFTTLPTPVNDTVNEEHETFTITINAGTGYILGSPTTLTVTITDNDPPAAPSGLSLTAGSGKLSASWTKPAGPVTGYQLRYKQTTATDQTATTAGDPSTGWVTSTGSITTTSGEITGLTNGTAYHVQVRATATAPGRLPRAAHRRPRTRPSRSRPHRPR